MGMGQGREREMGRKDEYSFRGCDGGLCCARGGLVVLGIGGRETGKCREIAQDLRCNCPVVGSLQLELLREGPVTLFRPYSRADTPLIRR